MEDINQATHAITDPSSSSSALERRPSGEEDPAAMTIEFLRARLLSERSVSKAARERAHQLSKKVSELEERLESEILLRKKLESDRLEILLKYRAELSEEYGDFFASSVGEGFPRDESVPDSPNSRKHDISEGFESYTPNQDEEGLPNRRLEQLERSDSSQQLSREEANDEDDETDHSGREKGVISWGRQKGSRKEFGYGTDWPGRSLSQRSLTSTDGESPQKKWAGKSVRQIRKRESRSSDTNERDNGQTQAREESNGKIGQRSDTRVALPCDDERDTEVERVLEQQAELIEQYKAEENAQRAWEAKFKKGKELSVYENDIMPSNSGVKLPATTSTFSDEKELLVKDDAAIWGTLPNQSLNENATRHSRKVHPEDEPNKLEGSQEQLESIHKNTSEDIDGPNAAFEDDGAGLSGDQSRVGISDEEPFRHERSTEGMRTHQALNENVTHGGVPSNMDSEQQSEQSLESSVEGRKSKYKPHLSSSFRFAIFPDVEPVAGSSPQMHGFTTYKHDAHGGGEVNESRGASEQVSTSGISDAHSHVSHDGASVVNHIGANETPPMGDRPIGSEDDESRESGKDKVQEETLGTTEKLLSHSMGVVMPSNPSKNLITSSHSFKEEMDRKMKGLGGNQDPQPGLSTQFSDLPSHMEPRGPSSGEYLQRHYPDFPSHPDHGFQPSKDFGGANFDNLALSGIYGSGSHASPYEETALRSHRRSIGAFDRVADVLRALEIAKLQVQTSSEQDDPFVGDTMDYDGRDRDAYYAEPPRLPSMYAAPPQPYASSVPYSSRGPATPPYMQGWGGYGAASSRQVVNAPYMHYPPRMPETQNMWRPPPPPPPSHGTYNSSLYHFDTRQHR